MLDLLDSRKVCSYAYPRVQRVDNDRLRSGGARARFDPRALDTDGVVLGLVQTGMSAKVVTITGGSGFVGQLLRVGLAESGYDVRVFDRMRGGLVNLLRRRYLGTSQSSLGLKCAQQIRSLQRWAEPALVESGVLRPSGDDILDFRSRMAERLRDSYAVVHLAGIPHPRMPGAIDADFRRINYEGSLNVFEAARDAGVSKFIFASSGQVYGINDPVRIDQLPILESNYCPVLEEGQNLYGWLKVEFERYMEQAATNGTTQGIAIRLEFPGLLSRSPANFFISTSIENVVAGFVGALEAPMSFGFESVNLADGEVDPEIVDVQEFIRQQWPEVPNHTTGNESLLSIAKARSLLGYRPVRDGRYLHLSLAGP
ncbi:MAG: NAD(P)-dependent oxidoreductase [Thermoanaerobaculia bacterium]